MRKLIRTRTLNTIFAGAAALVLFLFLWNYSETGNIPKLTQDSEKNNPPAYFFEKIYSKEYSELGLLDAEITSDSIKHDPNNNSATLKQPTFDIYEQGVHQWNIQSQYGLISDKGNLVTLKQQIVATSGDNHSIFKTPLLILQPEEKIAKTDKPVTLLSPTGFTRAKGLYADLAKRTITLTKDVRGQYDPNP